MAFLSYSQNAYLKWREKSLSPALWLGWEQLIMNLVCAPGGKAFWKERGYLFGNEFRRHIESELMNRKPHPDARPGAPLASTRGQMRSAALNPPGAEQPGLRLVAIPRKNSFSLRQSGDILPW
jgi:hypothetical protein